MSYRFDHMRLDTERAQTQAPHQLLPAAVRAQMEARLGSDFTNVRLYEDVSATLIGANAFTRGNDIHFALDQYHPETAGGRELIAHELTHVMQQRAGRVGSHGPGVRIVDDAGLEAEAERQGASETRSGEIAARDGAAPDSGDRAPATQPAGNVVQRQVTKYRLRGTYDPLRERKQMTKEAREWYLDELRTHGKIRKIRRMQKVPPHLLYRPPPPREEKPVPLERSLRYRRQLVRFRKALGLSGASLRADRAPIPYGFFDRLRTELEQGSPARQVYQLQVAKQNVKKLLPQYQGNVQGNKLPVPIENPPRDDVEYPIDDILRELPHEYATDPALRHLLQLPDPDNQTQQGVQTTATYKRLNEALAALEFIRSRNINPATVQSGERQRGYQGGIDFQGTPFGSATPVPFDPFLSPVPPQPTLEQLASSTVYPTENNPKPFSVTPERIRGQDVSWATKTYQSHTGGGNKGPNVTGIWNQTYTPPERIQELQQTLTAQRVPQGNVAPVHVPLDEAFVRENIAAEDRIAQQRERVEAEYYNTRGPGERRSFEAVISATEMRLNSYGRLEQFPTPEALYWLRKIHRFD
jgi:hypothetical protein